MGGVYPVQPKKATDLSQGMKGVLCKPIKKAPCFSSGMCGVYLGLLYIFVTNDKFGVTEHEGAIIRVMSVFDLLQSPDLLERVKEEFRTVSR
jgi:hypothetical protein